MLQSFAAAEVIGITDQQWESSTEDFWFNQECDEVREQEVYLGDYGIYLDNFVNPKSNPGPLYLFKNKVLVRGSHLLYNPSHHPKGNGLTVFNRSLLE